VIRLLLYLKGRSKQVKSLVKLLIRPASGWVVATVAILILLGAAAYAEETAAPGKAPDGYLFTLNRKSAETLYEMKEKRLKAVEAKRAADEAKQREQAKKAKVDRIQGKTGRVATSWQVLNR
jgi:hypothetical protein